MLISADYQRQQELAHEDPLYGHASLNYAKLVSGLMDKFKVESMLDYGAGKCRLLEAVSLTRPVDLRAYDPAIPELSKAPEPADMVCCIDVLEHIEPEYLDDVLNDLQRLTKVVGFFTICTVPAKRTLADGRNAHLIVEPAMWWLPKIFDRFQIEIYERLKASFAVIVTPC